MATADRTDNYSNFQKTKAITVYMSQMFHFLLASHTGATLVERPKTYSWAERSLLEECDEIAWALVEAYITPCKTYSPSKISM